MDERTEKFFEALNARISEAERDAAAKLQLFKPTGGVVKKAVKLGLWV